MTRKSENSSSEWSRFIDDVEALVSRATHLDAEEIEKLRSKVEDSIAGARDSVKRNAQGFQERATQVTHAADEYVHEKPWAIAGIAALAGIAIGLVMTRR